MECYLYVSYRTHTYICGETSFGDSMPIRSSYELTRLFLALSDVSRLEILNQLYEQTSVVDICRRFDLLVHEVVRHLRRLEDVGLVRQLPNGDYTISEYGKVVTTFVEGISDCLLYTSDAADEEDSVDLGGRRII